VTVVTPMQAMWKIAVASFIGTAIEFYDFFLYGAGAALFQALTGACVQAGQEPVQAFRCRQLRLQPR
jgi:hypothetical protein